MKANIQTQLKKEPNQWLVKVLVFGLIAILTLWAADAIVFSGIKDSGMTIAKNVISGILNPDMSLLLDFKEGVPALLLETAAIAFLGTVIGAIFALPLAFAAASNITSKRFNWIALFIISALRTFPPIIYGLMFIKVAGPGPFTGVLTFTVMSVGMLSKLFMEAIEDMDIRILESLDAAGCNTFHKVRFGILPQLFTDLVSSAIYRFEINIKDAAVLGIVGAGGIGAPLIYAMQAYNWPKVGAFLFGLIFLVLVVEFFSTKLRVKLARG
ncbi:MAG: phosphonate ABC transporter, permease protein PhnE [Erysipelotrichaceae bacterium]